MFIKPIEAESYEILHDKNRPIVGLKVSPIVGESFVLPMSRHTAAEIGAILIEQAKRE
jgi:hypothetical protein